MLQVSSIVGRALSSRNAVLASPCVKSSESVHEAARDVARRLRDTLEYQQSRRDRKKVEMLFAHLKRILKLDRLRLRGPSGAHDEFTLTDSPLEPGSKSPVLRELPL